VSPLTPVILATWEVETGRIIAQANSSQDPISIRGWAQWCIPVIPAVQGSSNRSVEVQADPSIKQDLISEITNAKMAGGGSQVAQHRA
jgi:hypothetical protein